MRKLALLAAVVCLISCWGMNAEAQTTGVYQGVSNASTTGANQGRPHMNVLCQNTYGASAYMCTVDEFFSTAGSVTGTAPHLWIQPVLHNCVYDGAQTMCQEAGLSTPFESATTLYTTCSAWTSATGDGTSVIFKSGTGWELMNETPCNSSLKVACCQPPTS